MTTPVRHSSLIELAFEPHSEADLDRLVLARKRLAGERPAIEIVIDIDHGQAILGARSEGYLDEILDRLRHEFNVKANIGALQIAYRETLTEAGTIDFTYRDPLKADTESARILIKFEPGAAGSGFVFEPGISSAETSREKLGAIEKGLLFVRDNGLIAGFPVIDVKATLIEASTREEASGTRAFEIAARAAFREAQQHCAPILLEPIMRVTITAPVPFMHLVKDDLIARTGHILKQAGPVEANKVCASVPLSKLIGYAKELHRLAAGRAEVALEFDRYDRLPASHAPDDEPFPPAIGLRA